jgi:predicted nuclease of predicted toxin-antitoxin system
MKVLLDTCVWGGAKQVLHTAGHEVIWSGDWPQDPGDEEILAQAHREGRVLVTLDKDFGELEVVYNQSHSGILRLVNLSARQQGQFACAFLNRTAMSYRPGPLSPPTPKESVFARLTSKKDADGRVVTGRHPRLDWQVDHNSPRPSLVWGCLAGQRFSKSAFQLVSKKLTG